MKVKKWLIPLLLIIASVFVFSACTGRNNTDEAEMEEFIANYDKSKSFVDNQVIIALTEEATFKYIFHDYTAEDFSEIGAIGVEELDGATSDTSGLTYRIRQCLSEDPSGGTIPEHLKHYNRIFCITLDKNDRDNVLRAVYKLRQRTDIYLAEPNEPLSPDV